MSEPISAQTRITAVTLPAEIDVTNAGEVAQQLTHALASGADVVIADLTPTVFCDSAGIRVFASAARRAAETGAELRLVIPNAAVLRVITLTGLDRSLPVYPSVARAVSPRPMHAAGTRPSQP